MELKQSRRSHSIWLTAEAGKVSKVTLLHGAVREQPSLTNARNAEVRKLFLMSNQW